MVGGEAAVTLDAAVLGWSIVAAEEWMTQAYAAFP